MSNPDLSKHLEGLIAELPTFVEMQLGLLAWLASLPEYERSSARGDYPAGDETHVEMRDTWQRVKEALSEYPQVIDALTSSKMLTSAITRLELRT